jgi:hypothetical protein
MGVIACIMHGRFKKDYDAERAQELVPMDTSVIAATVEDSPLVGQMRMAKTNYKTPGLNLRMSDTVKIEQVRTDNTVLVSDVTTGQQGWVPLEILSQ